MVNLLFIEGDDPRTKPGIDRSLYDPAAGNAHRGVFIDPDNFEGKIAKYFTSMKSRPVAICLPDLVVRSIRRIE